MSDGNPLDAFLAWLERSLPDEPGRPPHLLYLHSLAGWARTAAEDAAVSTEAAVDAGGGRIADERLKALVSVLAELFSSYLCLQPTHAERDGYGASHFDLFVKEALRCFAPSDFELPNRGIDGMIEEAVKGRRSMIWFEPPLDGLLSDKD